MASPWLNSLNRKYAKKWGVFKKPYKPSYYPHLYGHIQNDNDLLNHIKYLKNQDAKYSIFYKPNLSTFLSLIWLSQQQEYRNTYYTWCCFLTRFTTVYYKPYVEYLINNTLEAKLSIFDQQILLFKFFESYYYTVPHIHTFKSDYFFYNDYDYPYLLPYNNYVFKSSFTVYGVLWVGVERLRQKKYNEYVKAHYILHQSKYTPLRARHIIKNVVYGNKNLLSIEVNYRLWQLRLWYSFFLSTKSKKYQIVLHNFQSISDTYTAPAVYTLSNKSLLSYYQITRNYLNTYMWNSLDICQKLNTRWFRGLIYTPIVWGINQAFVEQIYQFPSQSRLDILYGSDYLIAHGANSQVYNRLIEKKMINVKYQAIGQFMIQDSIQDYFITQNLTQCILKNNINQQLTAKLDDYCFDSQAVNLLVSNDIFNRYIITRLFSNQTRVSPLKVRAQVHMIDNIHLFEHIIDYILCGNFYKIPHYMSKIIGIMSYFYWRSYNTEGIHQAHKGRLHLHHYIKKLNIQTLLSQQLYNVYKIVLYIWDIYKIKASAIGSSEMWNYMAVNYINWLHQSSYLYFFCLFKSNAMKATLIYYQQLYMNKFYTNFISHIMVRRYLSNYLTVFKYLRRAPYNQAQGTCIHGKNPERLQQWLVHVNWMRIIGLSRDQLPFYLYPESKSHTALDNFPLNNVAQENVDYLQELIKQTSHHQVDIYSCELFTIYKQTKFTPSIHFKSYIKTTNMLYDN